MFKDYQYRFIPSSINYYPQGALLTHTDFPLYSRLWDAEQEKFVYRDFLGNRHDFSGKLEEQREVTWRVLGALGNVPGAAPKRMWFNYHEHVGTYQIYGGTLSDADGNDYNPARYDGVLAPGVLHPISDIDRIGSGMSFTGMTANKILSEVNLTDSAEWNKNISNGLQFLMKMPDGFENFKGTVVSGNRFASDVFSETFTQNLPKINNAYCEHPGTFTSVPWYCQFRILVGVGLTTGYNSNGDMICLVSKEGLGFELLNKTPEFYAEIAALGLVMVFDDKKHSNGWDITGIIDKGNYVELVLDSTPPSEAQVKNFNIYMSHQQLMIDASRVVQFDLDNVIVDGSYTGYSVRQEGTSPATDATKNRLTGVAAIGSGDYWLPAGVSYSSSTDKFILPSGSVSSNAHFGIIKNTDSGKPTPGTFNISSFQNYFAYIYNNVDLYNYEGDGSVTRPYNFNNIYNYLDSYFDDHWINGITSSVPLTVVTNGKFRIIDRFRALIDGQINDNNTVCEFSFYDQNGNKIHALDYISGVVVGSDFNIYRINPNNMQVTAVSTGNSGKHSYYVNGRLYGVQGSDGYSTSVSQAFDHGDALTTSPISDASIWQVGHDSLKTFITLFFGGDPMEPSYPSSEPRYLGGGSLNASTKCVHYSNGTCLLLPEVILDRHGAFAGDGDRSSGRHSWKPTRSKRTSDGDERSIFRIEKVHADNDINPGSTDIVLTQTWTPLISNFTWGNFLFDAYAGQNGSLYQPCTDLLVIIEDVVMTWGNSRDNDANITSSGPIGNYTMTGGGQARDFLSDYEWRAAGQGTSNFTRSYSGSVTPQSPGDQESFNQQVNNGNFALVSTAEFSVSFSPMNLQDVSRHTLYKIVGYTSFGSFFEDGMTQFYQDNSKKEQIVGGASALADSNNKRVSSLYGASFPITHVADMPKWPEDFILSRNLYDNEGYINKWDDGFDGPQVFPYVKYYNYDSADFVQVPNPLVLSNRQETSAYFIMAGETTLITSLYGDASSVINLNSEIGTATLSGTKIRYVAKAVGWDAIYGDYGECTKPIPILILPKQLLAYDEDNFDGSGSIVRIATGDTYSGGDPRHDFVNITGKLVQNGTTWELDDWEDDMGGLIETYPEVDMSAYSSDRIITVTCEMDHDWHAFISPDWDEDNHIYYANSRPKKENIIEGTRIDAHTIQFDLSESIAPLDEGTNYLYIEDRVMTAFVVKEVGILPIQKINYVSEAPAAPTSVDNGGQFTF